MISNANHHHRPRTHIAFCPVEQPIRWGGKRPANYVPVRWWWWWWCLSRFFPIMMVLVWFVDDGRWRTCKVVAYKPTISEGRCVYILAGTVATNITTTMTTSDRWTVGDGMCLNGSKATRLFIWFSSASVGGGGWLAVVLCCVVLCDSRAPEDFLI